MALVKFKTKNPVIIDSMTGVTSTVYMQVDSVSVNESGYTSKTSYRIDSTSGKKLIKTDSKMFNRTEAITLFIALGANGSNFDQQLFDLIPKVALYRLGVAGYWELTSLDWEIDE